MNKFIFCAAFCAFSLNIANAQLLSVNTSNVGTSVRTESESDWSLYADRENRILYVDFEKINVNLSGVCVKDSEGKVVFKDETIWQLPINTIYEIDFSKFQNGDYSIELKTFTAVLRKNITLK